MSNNSNNKNNNNNHNNAEHKGMDYISMCKLMVDSDKELNQILDQKDVISLLGNEAWMIFGPSRTGKSTLLARIKSNYSKEQFTETLKKNSKSDEIFTIDDIKIASGHKAVTTVPNVFVKGKNLLFDLAGFIDIDPEREAVISLLNNSLFPRISSCKIIVVFDLSILIANLNLPLRKYYEEFIRLLTREHFKSGLASCIFVFTKADVHAKKFLEEEEETQDLKTLIQIKLLKFAADASVDDSDFGAFCSNIANRHFIVNYHEQDQNDIVKLIQRRLDSVKAISSKGMIFSTISNHNILSEKGGNYIREYNDKSIEFGKSIDTIIVNAKNENKKQKDEIKDINNNLRDTSKEINELKDLVTRINQENKAMNELIEQEKINLKNLETEEAQLSEKYQSFLNDLNNLEILNVVVLPSADWKKTFGNIHRVITNYKKPTGAKGHISVVILESKQYDVNKILIDKCKNLKEFDDLKIPFIYNNGKRRQGDKLNIKIDININTEDRIKISTESDEEHIVLCLSNLKVLDLAQSEAMVGYFNILIEKNKGLIQNSHKLIELNRSKINDNKAIEDSTLIRIKQQEQWTLVLQGKHESFTTVYNLNKESFIKLIEKEYDKTKALFNDNTFNSTCELSNILTNHKIESEIFKTIFEIKKRLITLMNNETPNMKLLWNLNAEVDHLIKL